MAVVPCVLPFGMFAAHPEGCVTLSCPIVMRLWHGLALASEMWASVSCVTSKSVCGLPCLSFPSAGSLTISQRGAES